MRFANDAAEARRIFERHHAELALMITALVSGGYQFVKSIPTLKPRVPLFTTTHVARDLEAVVGSGFPVLTKPFRAECARENGKVPLPARAGARVEVVRLFGGPWAVLRTHGTGLVLVGSIPCDLRLGDDASICAAADAGLCDNARRFPLGC
jgi:hypothetical protein